MAEYIERESQLRKDCPMRHENGNCLPSGGFCTAVNAPICAAIHNAYYMGKTSATDVVEVVHGYWKETTHITESKRGREIHSKLYNCSNCDAPNGRKKSSYCHWCGAKMDGKDN